MCRGAGAVHGRIAFDFSASLVPVVRHLISTCRLVPAATRPPSRARRDGRSENYARRDACVLARQLSISSCHVVPVPRWPLYIAREQGVRRRTCGEAWRTHRACPIERRLLSRVISAPASSERLTRARHGSTTWLLQR